MIYKRVWIKTQRGSHHQIDTAGFKFWRSGAKQTDITGTLKIITICYSDTTYYPIDTLGLSFWHRRLLTKLKCILGIILVFLKRWLAKFAPALHLYVFICVTVAECNKFRETWYKIKKRAFAKSMLDQRVGENFFHKYSVVAKIPHHSCAKYMASLKSFFDVAFVFEQQYVAKYMRTAGGLTLTDIKEGTFTGDCAGRQGLAVGLDDTMSHSITTKRGRSRKIISPVFGIQHISSLSDIMRDQVTANRALVDFLQGNKGTYCSIIPFL